MFSKLKLLSGTDKHLSLSREREGTVRERNIFIENIFFMGALSGELQKSGARLNEPRATAVTQKPAAIPEKGSSGPLSGVSPLSITRPVVGVA